MLPPEAAKYLTDRDTQAPPYREQRPYVLAFREFIRDDTNKSRKGLPWTPAVILDELWELWIERPKEPGVRASFNAEHYKTLERLRGGGKKNGVDDGLLVALLKRFLEVHGVFIPRPTIVRSIKEAVSAFSLLMPSSRRLSANYRWKPGEEVKVFEIRTYDASKEHGPTLDAYLALHLSEAAAHCCAAILFDRQSLVLGLGTYLFAARACFIRDSDLGAHLYHHLLLDVDLDIDSSRIPLHRMTEHRVYRSTAADDPYKALYDADHYTDPRVYSCIETKDASVIDFAAKYLRHFDY